VTSPAAAPVSLALRCEITEQVADRAAWWYPELSGPVQVGLRRVRDRPSCSLYAVRVTGRDGTSRQVLAKIRSEAPTGPPHRPGRPRLAGAAVGPEELTGFEYDGLRAIEAFAGRYPASFGAVRPLAQLPGRATLLMEYVEARTLRQALLAESRLVSWLPRLGGTGAHPSTWHHVGAWLRTFHDELPADGTSARQQTRDCVVERFEAYGAYLAEQLGDRALGQIASAGAVLAADVLPARLPMAVGHGDFAARNMFVDGQGRVTVFDPMARWRVPRLDDLCRFMVSLRLLGLQVQTRGAAYAATELARREEAFLAGYFVDGVVPRDQLRCYQLLLVLDKWSALVHAAAGTRGRQRNAYIRDEARRLLADDATARVAA